MNQTRITKLVAGLIAATAMVAPLTAQAADRVEQDITRERGVNNGISGYWVTVKERTYRWDPMYAQRINELFPGGSGLDAGIINQLIAYLNSMGIYVDNAKLRQLVNLIKNWKATMPGRGSWMWGDDYYNRLYNLSSQLSTALRGTPSYNSNEVNMAFAIGAQLGINLQWPSSDPLVLDLNGDGNINVTGLSAAKQRNEKNKVFVKEGSVLFDIQGNGKADRVEWVKPGEGILVDNRKNKAKDRVAKGQNLTVFDLLGDTEGNPGGFAKLARFFDAEAQVASKGGKIAAEGLGIIKGKELDDLLVWLDNGDGKAEAKELHTLASLGITEIRMPYQMIPTQDGEFLEQATFIRDGKPQIIQEVWFAREAADAK